MKHAGIKALAQLDDVLNRLRGIEALKEMRPGVFYRRSKAFLHFHEDPAGLFADVRLEGDGFTRMPVTTSRQRTELLRAIEAVLGAP